MAVMLWRVTYLRIPPVKINNIKKSIVTNLHTFGVPKPQITSHTLCRYFSKFHALKLRIALPALGSYETHNSTLRNTNPVSNELLSKSICRYYSSTSSTSGPEKEAAEKPPSLLQRFKQMYRDYWYVLVPVHLVTSAFWFSSFYYLAKSGVDIASLLETIGAGEKLVDKLRNNNSTMGYIAIAYALYKIATPIRYTVTLGGTTISIKYLKDWGYIKPLPPKAKIKSMISGGKEVILQQKDNLNVLYQKEKDHFIKDDKHFWRYFFFTKFVKKEKPPEKDKKEVKK